MYINLLPKNYKHLDDCLNTRSNTDLVLFTVFKDLFYILHYRIFQLKGHGRLQQYSLRYCRTDPSMS